MNNNSVHTHTNGTRTADLRVGTKVFGIYAPGQCADIDMCGNHGTITSVENTRWGTQVNILWQGDVYSDSTNKVTVIDRPDQNKGIGVYAPKTDLDGNLW